MIKLKLSEIYSCLGIEISLNINDVEISGVSTNTRTLNEGELFFALKGENFDAHDYIDIAVQKGACAVVVSKSVLDDIIPNIIVDDPLSAMQKIAAYCRSKINIPVIAVTGSSGKTTTKDMIAHILSTKYKVYSTNKNFNNEIGLPQSVFEVDEKHEIAVFELGMGHKGEIELLSNIVRPDISVITNIGLAHIEFLGSRENIFSAKMEIIEGMKNGGKIVLNSDDDLLRTVKLTQLETIFVGSGILGKEVLTFSDVVQTTNSIFFSLHKGSEKYNCSMPIIGVHNINNALLALECALQFNIPIKEAILSLSRYNTSSMRNEVALVKGIYIIKDYYNANPNSVKAALTTLASYQTTGNKIAILGDMGELGNHSYSSHSDIAKLCSELPIYKTFLVGQNYTEAVKKENLKDGEIFKEKLDLINTLKRFIKDKQLSYGDVVLIKGSRSMKMEEVYENIKSFINAEYSDYVSLPPSSTRLYIDITAIKENFNKIRHVLADNVEIMPMLKANAYGSGSEIIANTLNSCKYVAVADVKEAAMVKRVLPHVKIVIIYQPALQDIYEILDNDFIPAVSNLEFVEFMDLEAKKRNKTIDVHVEVDTGAGRLGVSIDECAEFFTKIKTLSNTSVDGIFMHYACAESSDENDMKFTERQTFLFNKSILEAEKIIGNINYKHSCCGAAIFNKKCEHHNMVRPGYMLYGYYPSQELRKKVSLSPALRFSSVIIQIKECDVGSSIGYNRTFITNRVSQIATVSVGYSNGLSRRMSNKGYMVVNGQRAPIVGTVCMDITMIDITDITGEVKIGDEVDIFDNINVTVEEMAEICDTIGYEIITRIEDKADRVEMF